MGDIIPEIIDNAQWVAATTSAMCYYDNESISSTKLFAPPGWHVALGIEDCSSLRSYLDPSANGITPNTAGGKMKAIGTDYWLDPNVDATNSSLFNGRGAGRRLNNGTFMGLKASLEFWSPSGFDGEYISVSNLYAETGSFECPTMNQGTLTEHKNAGISVRLVKDSTLLSDGQSGTFTDFDGNVYNTICINGKEWLAENYRCEHYYDGSPISIITDDVAWAADVNGAMCYYDNEIETRTPALVYFERGGVQEPGWRLPTITDFDTLISNLGGLSGVGLKLKEAGVAHWAPLNAGATNSSGFTGVGSGIRSNSFNEFKESSYMMTSTEEPEALLYYRGAGVLSSASPELDSYNTLFEKYWGVTIRCVRDVEAQPVTYLFNETQLSDNTFLQ